MLPQRFRFDLCAVGRVDQEGGHAWPHQGLAPDQPGLPDLLGRHAQPRFVHAATQVGEGAQCRLADVEDAALHGQVALQITQPAHALAPHVRIEGGRKGFRIAREAERAKGVRTGLGRQQHGQVAHMATHRSFGAHLRDVDVRGRLHGHAPLRRAHAKHMVPARRVAQAAHEVRAVGHAQHALGQGNACAATAAAGCFARVPSVACGAKHFVEGVRAQAKFGRVGFADDDGARGFHALRHQTVFAGHKVFHQGAAQSGAQSLHIGQVLDGLRDAVQPTHRLATGQLRIARIGLGEQRGAVHAAHDGIALRVEPVHLRQRRLHHLAA